MMNKKSTLFLCGMLAMGSALAQTHQLDSIVRTDASATYKFVPSYNGSQQTDGYTRYIRSGNAWENSLKMQFTLDADNRITTIDTYQWEDNAWAEIKQETRAYNAAGRMTELHIKTIQNEALADSIIETFAYSNGLLVEKTYKKLNNGSVVSQNSTSYTYNAAGQIAGTEEKSGTSALKAQYATAYTYTDGVLTEKIITYYDTAIPNKKEVYTHTDGRTHTKEYTYSSDTWTYKGKEWFYYYNANGQETGYCMRRYNAVTDSTAHTYTEQGDLASFKQYTSALAEKTSKLYQHTTIATAQCIGAAVAHAEITSLTDAHTQVLSSYTLAENGTQTCRDTYYIHALYPTTLPTTDAPLEIVAHDGRIFCDQPMRIYTPSGLDVTTQNGSLRGIYIVKVGSKATKIVVR